MSLFDAAAEVTGFLDEQSIPYAIAGGLAVQYWGEPRTTRDVDITVMVSPDTLDRFLDAAVRKFHPRLQDAAAFARENRVLLISAGDGTPVDISLGIPGYEEELVRHAVTVEVPGHHSVRIISAEDLVVEKCVAGRARDIEDVERVVLRHRPSLDAEYIRRWLREFVEVVEDHDPLAVFEDALKKTQTETA